MVVKQIFQKSKRKFFSLSSNILFRDVAFTFQEGHRGLTGLSQEDEHFDTLLTKHTNIPTKLHFYLCIQKKSSTFAADFDYFA